jgi:hypothetical protein
MAAKETPERQPTRSQDVGKDAFNAMAALRRWLVLVAAIAVGTCLGIALFLMAAVLISGGRHVGIHIAPSPTTTTPTTSGPRSP